jgi:putative transposase
VVVSKKNGKFKICVNFRKLNATTMKDPYPLPFIDEYLNIGLMFIPS